MSNLNNNCPKQEDILAYLQEELDPSEGSAIRNHISGCESCRKLESDLKKVTEVIMSAPPVSQKCNVINSVLARIEEKEKKKFVFFPILLKAAAAIVFIGLCLYTAKNMMPQSEVASKPKTDKSDKVLAVENAVAWLINSQESSGSWDPEKYGGKKEYEISLTAMSLLAMTRQDQSPEKIAPVINKAADFLLKQQGENGCFGKPCEGMMYNHGIATVALLELYNKNQDPALSSAIDKALAFTVSQQKDGGGWSYSKEDTRSANTSVSVWQLESLMLAGKTGKKEFNPSLRKGMMWLSSMVDEKGGFGYQSNTEQDKADKATTAMGVYCMMRASGNMPEMRFAVTDLKKSLMESVKESPNTDDFYRSYFVASAIRESHDSGQDKILNALQDNLASRREKSGVNAGSWAPNDKWGAVGGRLYTTVMATLSLGIINS